MVKGHVRKGRVQLTLGNEWRETNLDAVVWDALVGTRKVALLQLSARARGQKVQPRALHVGAEAKHRAPQQPVLARCECSLPRQPPLLLRPWFYARLPPAPLSSQSNLPFP